MYQDLLQSKLTLWLPLVVKYSHDMDSNYKQAATKTEI